MRARPRYCDVCERRVRGSGAAKCRRGCGALLCRSERRVCEHIHAPLCANHSWHPEAT